MPLSAQAPYPLSTFNKTPPCSFKTFISWLQDPYSDLSHPPVLTRSSKSQIPLSALRLSEICIEPSKCSETASTMTDSNTVLRPVPQKAWQLTPASNNSSTSDTPTNEQQDDSKDGPLSPSRTRSVLNLTSSTLFGIYSPGDGDREREDISQGTTPWGTGSQTPLTPATPGRTFVEDKKAPVIGGFERPQMRRAPSHHKARLTSLLPQYALRGIILFGVGMAYGVLVTHLHESQELTPIKLEGIDRRSWEYLVSWGVAGLVLGSLLPRVDTFFGDVLEEEHGKTTRGKTSPEEKDGNNAASSSPLSQSSLGADWFPAVRSIGVFVGIAFAIVSPTHPAHPGTYSLTALTEETPLAVHPPSLPHPRPRQPRSVVPNGPLKTMLHHLHRHRHPRHGRYTGH